MNIIFLDIDGVLNCQDFYVANNYKERRDEYGDLFHEPSKELLNKLIDETGAKVVISSTWRMDGLTIMKEMWKHRGMSGEVIGVTPKLPSILGRSSPRGLEIDYWLEDKGFHRINWSEELQQEYIDKSGIENYVIIDDDSDMLYNQKDNFVHILPPPRSTSGFSEEHYQQAKKILEGKFGILRK